MRERARWTPVGTYAALTGLLVAIALGAAALMHIAEHQGIPWSTLSREAQRFATGVEGVGLIAAIVLLVLLLFAYRLLGADLDRRLHVHLWLAAVLVPGIATHAIMAGMHLAGVPGEAIHVGLVALGSVAVALIGALAVTGEMIRRGASGSLPRWLHGPLAISLTILVAAHIVVAASHSAMHNSFV
jgi:hypothetical protein